MKKENIVSLCDISIEYRHRPALDHVSLQIERGDYLGIIGPNGSGKTTLLRVMLGLLTPDEGQVELFGQPISQFRDWRKIGYVPQKISQMEPRFPITVEEVVSLGRISSNSLWHKMNHEDTKAVEKALVVTGLTDKRSMLLSQLSGGQQQRVYIAKALASEPELLILDEPTTGVDMESQEKFYEFLSELSKHGFVKNGKDGLTLVLVSHDIDVVVNEVNKIACLNKTLVYHGKPKEFVEGNYLEKLYGKARRFILHNH